MLRLDSKIPLNLNSDYMIYPILYEVYFNKGGRTHQHNDGVICPPLEISRENGALCGGLFHFSASHL